MKITNQPKKKKRARIPKTCSYFPHFSYYQTQFFLMCLIIFSHIIQLFSYLPVKRHDPKRPKIRKNRFA